MSGRARWSSMRAVAALHLMIGAAACSSSAPTTAPTPTPTTAPSSPSIVVTTPPPATPVPSTVPSITEPTPVPSGTTYVPTAPTPTSSCSPATEPNVCMKCLLTVCCAQVLACDQNADCAALDQCTAQCDATYASGSQQSSQCYAQCDAAHPTGLAVLQGVFQCADSACATQCQ